LRFRLQRVGLTSDIENAFLNISITPEQRNFLRYSWVDNVQSAEPKLEIYRFTTVVLGAISSRYLLHATIWHHLEKYLNANEEFLNSVIKSLYFDDFIWSFDSEEEAFAQFYKLKDCFKDGGLNLRKWKSNIEDLTQKIAIVENNIEQVLDAIKEHCKKTISDLESCQSTQTGTRNWIQIEGKHKKTEPMTADLNSDEIRPASNLQMKAMLMKKKMNRWKITYTTFMSFWTI